jgi:hypothetical protein
MKKLITIIFCSLILFSCEKKKEVLEMQKIEVSEKTNDENLEDSIIKNFKPNPNITKFKIIGGIYSEEEIAKMEFKTQWYLNEKEFNPKMDTIKYLKDKIYISYLTFNGGCDENAGDYIIKGDSLIINLVNLRDYVCTERICDRVIFEIKNPENKKYKIAKW